MSDIKKYIKNKQNIINKELIKILPKDNSLLSRAMRYCALSNGKKIRAILVMASCSAAGGTESKVLPIACAVELLHAFSLIHDDLPAMDDDALRRGRPAAHIKFDEATAILAADALFALAYEVLANVKNIRPEVMLKIISNISKAIGVKGMCAGQSLDMQSAGKKINLKELKVIHSQKTGALISTCVQAGALSAGADKKVLLSLIKFSSVVGLSFQIKDDILDVVASTKKIGKTAGSDKENKKATYPAVLGLKKSIEILEKEYKKAVVLAQKIGPKAKILKCIAEFIIKRDN